MFGCGRRTIAILLAAGALACSAGAEPLPEELLAKGRVDDAILALQKKLANSTNDAESYNLLCRAYLTLGNWDEGIAACQKATSLQPGNGEYHLWLGRIYGEKADNSNFFSAASLAKKVRTEFETAVRLAPDNVEAHADLAEFYLEAPGIIGGGSDKAEAQAVLMAPLDPAQAHLVRAKLAEKKEDWTAAESEYRAAIQANGGKPGTWMNLAQFQRRRGHLDQMEDAIQHATAAEKNQHVLMQAAEVLVRAQRDLPMAAQLLRRYLAGNTVEGAPAFKAHYLLGMLLEKNGDKPAAAQEYRAALALASNFAVARTALSRVGG